MSKPILRKLAMALLPLTLLLLLLEGVFRLLPQPAEFPEAAYKDTYSFSTLFIPHPYCAFAPNPDHPAFYGHGLREDRELLLDSPHYRIICMGGSATYGSRVERQDAFPAQLEQVLKGRGKDVEVLNAGVHAYSTANIIGWLSLRMIDLHPKMVIFYVGFNDVFNWVNFSGFMSDYSHAQKSWQMPDLAAPFWTHSALLRRLTHWRPPLVHIHAVAFKKFSEDYAANLQAADPDVFSRNLITLAAICRGHGAIPVFALEATDFGGHAEGSKEGARAFVQGMAEADQAMADAAARASVDRIYTASLNNQPNDFADFIHLNENGNRKLAEIMANAIAGKLPDAP